MKSVSKHLLSLIPIFLLLAVACTGQAEEPTPFQPEDETKMVETEPIEAEPKTLRVMTHDSFAMSEEVLAVFEEEHNATVEFLAAGDTGSAVNKAVLSAGNPLADVFYGVDSTFLSRALEGDIFLPYESPLLAKVDDALKLDDQNRVSPVDFGDVCLNYDKNWFIENGVEPPVDLDDLLKPEYKGLLAVQNPALSSPGLSFLMGTIARYGQDGYLEFWQGLVDNDVMVVDDWEQAYYEQFTIWGGGRPIVVSYASSPPFEVLYAEEPVDEPPTGVVYENGSCFRQIEFVGILKGTENEKLAQAWVDFMLDVTFQEDIPLQMYVFPVNPDAALDPVFVDHLVIPDTFGALDPADIAANRESWIDAWRELVLK